MPTYEYLCTSQGHRLEVVQKFTDDPLTICPECGGLLRKVIFPVGVVFKGSGFYRNDSRDKKSNGSSKPSGDSGGDARSGDAKSGDPKSGDSADSTRSGDSGTTPKTGDTGSASKETSTSSTGSTSGTSSGSGPSPTKPAGTAPVHS